MFDRLGRIFSRDRVKYYGNCPNCQHDWREHPGGDFGTALDQICGECQYEFDHEQRETSEPGCRVSATPPPA